MASSVFFRAEIWPVFYLHGKSENGGNPTVVRAPIEFLMLDGKMYVNTVGSGFPTAAVAANEKFDEELKWRSALGPICLGKMQVLDASRFGNPQNDTILGVHKFGFV